MDGKLAVRNPAWTEADINDWRLCWAELWAAGVSWEWQNRDRAGYVSESLSTVTVGTERDAVEMEGWFPLPDTAVLLQLLSGVKSCTVEVSDTCHWLLERLVETRCRVRVRVP